MRTYHTYEGGPSWVAKLSYQTAKTKKNLRVSVELLTPEAFVAGLTEFGFPVGAIVDSPNTFVKAKKF